MLNYKSSLCRSLLCRRAVVQDRHRKPRQRVRTRRRVIVSPYHTVDLQLPILRRLKTHTIIFYGETSLNISFLLALLWICAFLRCVSSSSFRLRKKERSSTHTSHSQCLAWNYRCENNILIFFVHVCFVISSTFPRSISANSFLTISI